MSPAERDAMKDFIVRTIDTAVKSAVGAIDLDALRGKDGENGKDGRNGKDAIGIDEGVIRDGELILVRSDGQKMSAGRVVGANGKDGKDAEPVDTVAIAKDVLALIPVPRDGKDGIASMDDLRSEVSKAVEALVAPTVEKQVTEAIDALPTLQYQGVFREGTVYKAGHCVTWAGAMWHADSETKDKPGEGATAWTLMVKKGDKGRDAK